MPVRSLSSFFLPFRAVKVRFSALSFRPHAQDGTTLLRISFVPFPATGCHTLRNASFPLAHLTPVPLSMTSPVR